MMTWLRPSRMFKTFQAAALLVGAGLVATPALALSYMPAYRNVERVAVVCHVQREKTRQEPSAAALCDAMQDALNATLGAPWQGLVSTHSGAAKPQDDPGTFLIRVEGVFAPGDAPEGGSVVELAFTVHRSGHPSGHRPGLNEPMPTPPPPPLRLTWQEHEAALDAYVRHNFAEPLRGANPHKR